MPHHVHVLGNAGADLILRLARMPADGETLIARDSARAPGGKGLNQAVVAARAGALVRFQAPLGADADAEMVRARLAGEPIRAALFPLRPLATDLSVVMVDAAGGNRIVSASLCADSVTPAEAVAFAGAVPRGDVLLMQGNLSRAATMEAARVAGVNGATVVLNLAPCRWPGGAGMPACVLVVNAIEAAQATGMADPGRAAASLLLAGARGVIVTLGGDGCLIATGDGMARFPARNVTVIDTTGAGDTFCGVLAAGLARGDELSRAVAWGQRAAAITVARAGAYDALPSAAELAACR